MNVNASEIHQTPTPMPAKLKRFAIVAAAIGVVLLIPAALVDSTRFLANWLTMFAFIVSIGVGALLLVALEYAVGAKWSVPFRRIIEFISALVPVSLLLVIPVILGMSTLYEWTHAEVVAADHILHMKEPYLNVPFWIIRTFFYFAIWIVAFGFYVKGSRKQDSTGDIAHTKRARVVSPIFIILYGLTMTFASIDWIMSLAPHWFSTMFGVYFAVAGMVGALAATTFAATQLKLHGMLPNAVGRDHFYNLGGLLFAMNTFWAYIAFAQFLLIWYGNIPIERYWFAPRTEGGWMWITLVQIIGHFVVPFFALISREAKMNLLRLRWISVWILAAHLIDMYWITVPSLRPNGPVFSWHELWFAPLAVGIGLFVWLRSAKRSPIVPVRDPRLEIGLSFHL